MTTIIQLPLAWEPAPHLVARLAALGLALAWDGGAWRLDGLTRQGRPDPAWFGALAGVEAWAAQQREGRDAE